jgi:hypothetical protein
MRRIISTTLVVSCAMLGLFAAPGSGAMAAGVSGSSSRLRSAILSPRKSMAARVSPERGLHHLAVRDELAAQPDPANPGW